LFAELSEGTLGALRLAEAHHGLQLQGLHPPDEQVRCGEEPGQPLGSSESDQRVGVMAARQVKQPACVAGQQPRRWVGFGSDGALGALDPGPP
jgi:hypothetical protein